MGSFWKSALSTAIWILFGFISTTAIIFMFYIFIKVATFILEKL